MSALVIVVAAGDDLTSACARGLAAAQETAQSATVHWGAVSFEIVPSMDLKAAHAAFFAAAKQTRALHAAERRAMRDFGLEPGL